MPLSGSRVPLAPCHRTAVRLAILVLLVTSVANRSRAQAPAAPPLVPVRTHLPWRTLETEHFAFHYPAELEAWTYALAQRADAGHEAVRRVVGYAPPKRVHVVVEDPFGDPNGAAFPFVDAPAILVWPVPAGPRSAVGDGRSWPELLLVHEFAHVAHLTRPSRNRWRRLLTLPPATLGPIPTRTPRWVWEGYATYVEGALTGSGRPHAAWRPAFLRQWALEGRLPSYAAVSGTQGFAGGSFAYLAGSAYFEWLVAQRGDSALPHLWRRLTAREVRGFDDAFRGVFPGRPDELYARWTAEVTAEAVAAERRLRDAGLVEGALVQRLVGATGDPAASPDGEHVALVLRPENDPPRVVVWRAGADAPDTARARQIRRMLERDPQDVAPVDYLPPPKKPVATLHAKDGRAFTEPRFLPDGRRLLLVRDETQPDGVLRPDLWSWDFRAKRLRRVTRHANVRQPDPAPDGRTALATRCRIGSCGVVRVDLSNGDVTELLTGAPDVTYDRPRWSPDGRRFAVAEQRAGRWRTVVASIERPRVLRTAGPEDGSDRFDAAWLDDETLVLVSECGGVPNVERVTLATDAVATLTRTTGAAMAPEPVRGARTLWFLALTSHGFDVRALPLDSARGLPIVALDAPSTLDRSARASVAAGPGAGAAGAAVRARAPIGADTFDVRAPRGPRAYGAGPPRVVLFPVLVAASDGESAIGVLAGSDPVGRLGWTLQGAASGDATTWRGGALSAAWRGLRPTLEGQLFAASHTVRAPLVGALAPALDATYRGALLASTYDRWGTATSLRVRAGASLGALDPRAGGASIDRGVGFLEARGTVRRGRGTRIATLAVGGHTMRGETADSGFSRVVGTAALTLQGKRGGVRVDAMRALADEGTPAYELPLLGGLLSPLVDRSLLSQRLAFPLMPSGALAGRRVETVRAALTGTVQPFAWWGRARDTSPHWLRVVGVEASSVTGPAPIARLPGVHLVGGIAYSFDDPLAQRTRGYLSAVITP